MTISNTLARNDYSGTTSTGPYVYAFKITAATDLQVIKRSSAGVETVLTYLTHYTVAGAGNDAGGSITLTSAPLSTDTLSIRRALPITQPASIRNQGQYFPETIEDQLDRGVLIQQQQEDAIARSLKLPPSYNPLGRARHLVPTAGAVVVGDGTGFTTAVIDRTGVVLPGASRTVATLSAYLANNALANVLDFGADPTGVADSTVAFTKAVAGIATGGVLYIPCGFYKLTDEITLAAGIIVQGAGSTDIFYGAPPNSASIPSYVFQVTAGKACFVIGNGMSNVRIADVAMGNARTPTVGVGTADGKFGVKITGTYPQHIFHLTFERLTFYGLHYSISAVDTLSGTVTGPHPFDWNVSPVRVTDCRFYYPVVGVYVDTNNADLWTVGGCSFFIPSSGYGLWLYRFGLFAITDCNGGGNSISNNAFLRITGNGAGGIDSIVVERSQAETLTQFIYLDTTGTYGSSPFYITARNCYAQLGADVYLGNACRFISEDNHWDANVYVDNPSVRVSSNAGDYWQGTPTGTARFLFLQGNPSQNITQLFSGPGAATAYVSDTRINGLLERRIALAAAPTSEVYAIGDRIINSTPGVGSLSARVCTVAGAAASTTRANSTAYSLSTWAIWTTGTTVWECTTAGTSTGAAPSIAGKVVGDTVTDGTVVWTLRSLTTASFQPVGRVDGSSADNGDASVVLTTTSAPTERFDTVLTANRTVTLPSNATSYNGQQFRIVRTGLGAFTLTVQDATPSTLKVMPSATAAFVDAEFTGTAWKLSGYGTL